MKRLSTLFTLLLIAAFGMTLTSSAQDAVPAPEARPSPLSLAQASLDGAYMKVVYSSPRMRGRTIFGDLVSYDNVWRTGANEATEITTTADIMIGDTMVPAGTYSIFTIPGEDEWTVIFNEALGLWGSFNYDESMDVARITVPVTTMDQAHEAFTIAFEEAEEGVHLAMMWDKTKVAVPVMPAM